MSLLNLPNELLLFVAEGLRRRDLRSFYQTNRRLRALLTCVRFDEVDETTMLKWAAETGHEALLRLALYKEANISGWTPENEFLDGEHWAVIKYDNILLELRLRASTNRTCVERYQLSALHRAALGGHERIAQILLDNGAEVSARTSRGDNALHIASCGGHQAVVSLLLEREACVDERGWKGCTALHFAAMQGHQDLATIFLGIGADINARNVNDATPLHMAAWRGHIDMARLLVVMAADTSATDNLGSTPLHVAAENGHEEIVRLLLDSGAVRHTKNAAGNTAFAVACAGGHRAMGNRLLRIRSRRWSLVDIVSLGAFK